ncbi:preprotein translocase subunit SecY [Paraferrimonas sp. SM1919]|uniref:preprotein translocase subunit SecY n=1 Tax=Paraferrimonas sp. SM1919 TaxID=2662263 RepID=UPI0013D75C07|nr:preprotein translocase subunit SecY [Paraferrimonas sp. SM1919]
MAKPGLESNGKGGLTELKHRLLFVLGAIIVFRAGSFVPIPGIDAAVLAEVFNQQKDTILGMFNMFSGGALERASIFALGIMPYISASIIMQLMTVVHPTFMELKKEGEAGRKKISQYTRYGTLVLGTLQSIGIASALNSGSMGEGLVTTPGPGFVFVAIVSLVTGTMFLMWLGEQITERGIGNGISILIFAGIVAGLPSAFAQTAEQARQGDLNVLVLLLMVGIVFAVTYFVVFVERGQRRIVVNYAKRQQGRKVFAGQSSHLPLKLNMAGVIPPIFASSIILFPSTLASWFGQNESMSWLSDISLMLSPGQPLYVVIYAAAIIFFCFFYTALVFNPRETAENLKKSGAFVPGIRPGEQTSRYIDKVMTRLTLAGALYITFICLIPEFMLITWNVPFYFGGTSLLIMVVVIMDFMAQVQTHMMSLQYESVMKKANLVNKANLDRFGR